MNQLRELVLIYVTAKDESEARIIVDELLKAKLIACANLIADSAISLFSWNGSIQQEKEAIIIMKTKKSLLSKVIDEIKKLHSYDCPCIISLPIQQGNPDYLNYVYQNTL